MRRLTLLLFNIFIASTTFCQFQAKISFTPIDETRVYTVYSDLHRYRYEFTEHGEEGIFIVKPDVNQTYVLMPSEKKFIKTTCDGFYSLMNDPVQASLYFKETQKEKMVGHEQQNGYDCVKKEYYAVYHNPEKEVIVYTVWFSSELNFPVRFENHVRKNNYMLLSDVKSWEPQENYFEVPEGYTEIKE